MKKITSFMLVFAFLTLSFANNVYAEDRETEKFIINEYDEKNDIRQAAFNYSKDVTMFVYQDKMFSYAAQMTREGKLQFSFYDANNNSIFESSVYNISDLQQKYKTGSKNGDGHKTINNAIIKDLNSYVDSGTIHVIDSCDDKGYSVLTDAIIQAFGSNYTGKVLKTATRSHYGNTYTLVCKEAQTTSYSAIQSFFINANSAITVIVAWVITGGWNWIGTLSTIIKTVVKTVIAEGIIKTVKSFTAKRTNVSHMLTRTVTVNGVSGIQYYAGWTRKWFFFKGDLGWTHDTSYNYNVKHSDFGNLGMLIDKGFQSFINGGY